MAPLSTASLASLPLLSSTPTATSSTIPTSSLVTPALSAPLPSTGEPSHSLITSNALPPLPAKILEKIKAGQFLDLKELLPDNAALLSQLRQLHSLGPHHPPASSNTKLREIRDPLSWVFCFLYFIAASSDDIYIQQLSAYGQIVIHLAQKHGGSGWLAYDRLFRQQKAAGSTVPWSDLNSSLMAATVLGLSPSRPGRSCLLCSSKVLAPSQV